MKLESETIYCDFDEKFIPIDEDVKCLSCSKGKAVKISENYLSVDICYDNGGGSDVTKLYLCYEKHVQKVKTCKQKQIIYNFSY